MASFAFTFQQALGLGRLPLSKRLSPFATTVQKSSSSSPSFHRAQRRSYSEQIADGVEPPEYLQEGERKIFDKIRDELRPTQLEVRHSYTFCGSQEADCINNRCKTYPAGAVLCTLWT